VETETTFHVLFMLFSTTKSIHYVIKKNVALEFITCINRIPKPGWHKMFPFWNTTKQRRLVYSYNASSVR